MKINLVSGRIIFLAIIAALWFAGVASAQMTTGSILGTVHDETGAVVAGAKVVVNDNGKGTAKTDLTDADGGYNVPFLLPGTYDVTVTMAGFKTSVTNNVTVDIDQKARI